jgi:uncharacterized membrane protein
MIKSVFLPIHIAAGIAAILLGAVAVAVRKGGLRHAQAGTWFARSMIALGVTASILEPLRTPKPGSPISGMLVCYFIATSWVSACRRDGKTGRFEMLACVFALGAAVVVAWSGLTGTSSTPVGSGPVFILAGLFLIAGLLDLRVALLGQISAGERIRRHVWRMCFAFFVATGSFFLGQQQVMAAAVRGSPALYLLGFAPIAVMAFWLVRLRFAKAVRRLSRAPTRALARAPAR